MGPLEIFLVLLGLSLLVGLVFNRSSIPLPLMLVIAGMIVGFLPGLPPVELQPELILNVFLPLLVYSASANFSWKEVRHNLRPIILLSIGHVFFIAACVAWVIHALLPPLGWPLSFVLGAIVAPPDDIAILAIAEKIYFPSQVLTILKGESLLNDATALILFRFSLAAVVTHEFAAVSALSAFLLVVIGETLYGITLGHLLGQLRVRIKDPMLQMMASLLTPFLAYLPPENLGGSGVLATVVTGFVIGHQYLERFPPEVRLTSLSVWTTLSYALQSIIFLLVGLNFERMLQGISTVPWLVLLQYSLAIILTVILGRFIWVFPSAYLPHYFFASIRKRESVPPWQQPFLVSWCGMRGVISLAAVLAIPQLPPLQGGADPKNLLLFLVFTVIIVTLLLQGLSLPWLIKKLGLHCFGQREKYHEHLSELTARLLISKASLRWLRQYKKTLKNKPLLIETVELRLQEYKTCCQRLSKTLNDHHRMEMHNEEEEQAESRFLSAQINEMERAELLKLWHENKISHGVRTKILQQLDHRYKHING